MRLYQTTLYYPVGGNWTFSELEAVAMWSYSEGLPLRDFFAVEILKGLMLRKWHPGYSDRGAIDEAYRLADYMVECREYATAETAEAGQHPPTPAGVPETQLTKE